MKNSREVATRAVRVASLAFWECSCIHTAVDYNPFIKNRQTMAFLVCLAVRFPARITLLRGNHETRQITQVDHLFLFFITLEWYKSL